MCRATRNAKLRYRTLKDAKVARRMSVSQGEQYLRVYRCGACAGYHLTSQPRLGPASTAWTEPARSEPAAA